MWIKYQKEKNLNKQNIWTVTSMEIYKQQRTISSTTLITKEIKIKIVCHYVPIRMAKSKVLLSDPTKC